MLNYKYAYFFGNLILLPFWLILFFHRRDLRKEMFIVSLLAGIVAFLTAPIFLYDYWMPDYLFPIVVKGKSITGLSDFLYGFFGGGVSSSIYEEVFGKRFSMRSIRGYKKHHLFIPIALMNIFILLSLNLLFGLRSIYALLIAQLIPLLIALYIRKDLVTDSVVSGLLFGIITVVLFFFLSIIFPGFIDRWWKLDNLRLGLIAGIPTEELLWAMIFGASAGPFYEFFTGRRLVNNKNN